VETGIVIDACLAVGKNSNTAYANRRRDPLFAFAGMWEPAFLTPQPYPAVW
jgi:putative SOS response-associated peptidase YedK